MRTLAKGVELGMRDDDGLDFSHSTGSLVRRAQPVPAVRHRGAHTRSAERCPQSVRACAPALACTARAPPVDTTTTSKPMSYPVAWSSCSPQDLLGGGLR